MGEAYVELMSRMKEIETVGQIQGLLGWDQEVMMPLRLHHCEQNS